jgi:hypothetical protein
MRFLPWIARAISFAILMAVTPAILPGSTVYFTSSSDTTAFNGVQGSLTLGNNNCIGTHQNGTCTLTATAFGTSDGAVTLSLTMPDLATSPFSYSGDPSLITTSGSPALSVTLTDIHGDSAQGTFLLTNLLSNGVKGTGGFAGVDIDGSISIDSITAGTHLASFDSLFGLPSATALAFTLDVGNCKGGAKNEPCIVPRDPSAAFLGLDLTTGTTSQAPEPGTFGLLGAGLGLILLALRRPQSRISKSSL